MKGLWSLIIAVVLFGSCAQIRTPTGGAKDTQGPLLLSSSPENLSTEFKGKSITIEFDEYVQLQNVREQVIISPPLENTIDLTLKGGKTVILNLKEEALRPNTTYTINFGEAIKDNNEGNVLDANTFLFSTGDYIDSLKIEGTALTARFMEPCTDCSVFAFEEASDSLTEGRRPYYVSRCDAQGAFTLSNLNAGSYQLIALKDLDKDMTVDLSEPMGFLPENIAASNEKDSSLVLKVAAVSDNLIGLKTAEWSKDGRRLRLVSHGPLDSLTVSWPQSQKPAFEEERLRPDSAIYWFYPSISSGAEMYVGALGEAVDTIRVGRTVSPDSLWTLSAPNLAHMDDTLTIALDRPISSVDSSKISLIQDSLSLPFTLIQDDLMSFKMTSDWEEGKTYSLALDIGSLLDIYGTTSDSIRYPIKVPIASSLGEMTLDIKLDSGLYVVELLDKDRNVIRKKKAHTDLLWSLPPMSPGNYFLRVFEDLDDDGVWTIGNYNSKRAPEPVYFHKEAINLRANWELELIIEPEFRE